MIFKNILELQFTINKLVRSQREFLRLLVQLMQLHRMVLLLVDHSNSNMNCQYCSSVTTNGGLFWCEMDIQCMIASRFVK